MKNIKIDKSKLILKYDPDILSVADYGREFFASHEEIALILKCDIRKFFANIDHQILLAILSEYIPDKNVLWLLGQIIRSFSTKGKFSIGLPLGNLTSQILVNIYMNKFDQFIKHKLRANYYIRYADDFVFLSENKQWLESIIVEVEKFLNEGLKLEMHPDKVFIKTLASGVDFLGYVVFPKHIILRAKTRRRMLRKIRKSKFELKEGIINEESFKNSIQSYLDILKHCQGRKIGNLIERIAAFSS